jgi:hypothetical protein
MPRRALMEFPNKRIDIAIHKDSITIVAQMTIEPVGKGGDVLG